MVFYTGVFMGKDKGAESPILISDGLFGVATVENQYGQPLQVFAVPESALVQLLSHTCAPDQPPKLFAVDEREIQSLGQGSASPAQW